MNLLGFEVDVIYYIYINHAKQNVYVYIIHMHMHKPRVIVYMLYVCICVHMLVHQQFPSFARGSAMCARMAWRFAWRSMISQLLALSLVAKGTNFTFVHFLDAEASAPVGDNLVHHVVYPAVAIGSVESILCLEDTFLTYTQ